MADNPLIAAEPNSVSGKEMARWQPAEPVRGWKYIVLHHSATERGSVESIHQSHLQRKDSAGRPWRGIGYHFVIGNGQGMKDGSIEPTFRWDRQIEGAHAGKAIYNQFGIGICLIGNFQTSEPTKAQLQSLRVLLDYLKKNYSLDSGDVAGHTTFRATHCPGQYFPLNSFTENQPESNDKRPGE